MLPRPASPCLRSGLDVLPKFRDFIKSSPEEAAAKEADLVRGRRAAAAQQEAAEKQDELAAGA